MIKVKVGQVYEVMGKRKEVNGVFPEEGIASFRRMGIFLSTEMELCRERRWLN